LLHPANRLAWYGKAVELVEKYRERNAMREAR
jgi:hypothetical protein